MDPEDAIEVELTSDGVSYVRLSPAFRFNSNSMWVACWLYNDQSVLVCVEHVHVPPDVYAEWGHDDDVVVDHVLDKLELRRLGYWHRPIIFPD